MFHRCLLYLLQYLTDKPNCQWIVVNPVVIFGVNIMNIILIHTCIQKKQKNIPSTDLEYNPCQVVCYGLI